jgi:hypothetical protein
MTTMGHALGLYILDGPIGRGATDRVRAPEGAGHAR